MFVTTSSQFSLQRAWNDNSYKSVLMLLSNFHTMNLYLLL